MRSAASSIAAWSTAVSPVEGLLGFFSRNLVATTAVSIGLVVLSLVLNRVQDKLDPGLDELEGKPASDVEEGVEPDGDAGAVGDRLHREHDPRHE